jgi:3,4-dihydroxy 2-butanone 4-phosphate synthase/GTP cyclohydrolase II
LSDRLSARLENKPEPAVLRDYGVGAQILLDLGVGEMILLSNSKKTVIAGLEGYGLKVIERREITGKGKK